METRMYRLLSGFIGLCALMQAGCTEDFWCYKMPERGLEQCFATEGKCDRNQKDMAAVLARQGDRAESCRPVSKVFCYHKPDLPAKSRMIRTQCSSSQEACENLRSLEALTARPDELTECTSDADKIRGWFEKS